MRGHVGVAAIVVGLGIVVVATGCDGRSLSAIRIAVAASQEEAQSTALAAAVADAEERAAADAEAEGDAARSEWAGPSSRQANAANRWRQSMQSRLQSLIDDGWPDHRTFGRGAPPIRDREACRARLQRWVPLFLAAIFNHGRPRGRGASAYFPAEVMVRDHAGNRMWFEIDVEIGVDVPAERSVHEAIVRIEPIDRVGSLEDE